MKLTSFKITVYLLFALLIGCKKNENSTYQSNDKNLNQVTYSKNLAIYKHDGFSVVKVLEPWTDAHKTFTYILKEKNGIVPDSLQKYPSILVPLQSVVVTSTTNIPFLEMLGVEKKLKGFPHTDYISSIKTRKLIQQGLVKNVGQNEKLNIEQLIDISPELIITFGVSNNNPALTNLEKSGLKVLIQADWMEQSALGKAEWIKLYGALFGKEKEAKQQFDEIVSNYNQVLQLVSKIESKKTVMYGSMYENQWYVAKGGSWISQFITDAKANYLWKDLKGSGSLPLSFESILEKGQKANYWITGSFPSLSEMEKTNPHYSQFDAFKNKQVFTFESEKGANGGTVFYELAPSRPDLVLKDYIKIFHPEILPNYSFTFAKKIN